MARRLVLSASVLVAVLGLAAPAQAQTITGTFQYLDRDTAPTVASDGSLTTTTTSTLRPIVGATVEIYECAPGASCGWSLAAAQLVSTLRDEYPQSTVGDVYGFPRLAAMAERMEVLRAMGQPPGRPWVRRTPRPTQGLLLALTLAVQTVVGLRWLVWLFTLTGVLAWSGEHAWAPTVSWWWIAVGWLALVSPAGRMTIAAAGARFVGSLSPITPIPPTR